MSWAKCRSSLAQLGLAVAVALTLLGCDPAREDYARCLELEQSGKLDEARSACEAAVAKAPEGPSAAGAKEVLTRITKTELTQYAEQFKKNTDCTKAQLALMEANDANRDELTKAKHEACKDVKGMSSAAPSSSAAK